MTTAVDKWPAYSRLLAVLLAVAPAGHLPTAPTPRTGTRPAADSSSIVPILLRARTAASNLLAAASSKTYLHRSRNLSVSSASGAGIFRGTVSTPDRGLKAAMVLAAWDLDLGTEAIGISGINRWVTIQFDAMHQGRNP